MVDNFDVEQQVEICLEAMNMPFMRQSFDRRFKAMFGISFQIFSDVWMDVGYSHPKHLLYALHFLKTFRIFL